MTTIDEKIWHLQHCPLFSGVSEEKLKDLEHITVMVKLKPQERILAAHQEERAIWLIKEGLVSLTYGDAEGKDATVMLLSAGDLFGASLPYADVQAISAEMLKRIQIWKLTGLIEEADISHGIGAMGMPGATAYGGLIDVLRPNQGDTIWVSGAGGAVGSMVG